MDITQIPDDQLQSMIKPQDLTQLSDSQLSDLASSGQNGVQSPDGMDTSNSVSRLPWYAQQAGLASRAIMEGMPLPGEMLANVTARPIMNAFNEATGNPYRVPDQTQVGTQAADAMRLATPQNATERMELAAGRAAASIPFMGAMGSAASDLASLAPEAEPLVGTFGQKLAQGLQNVPAYGSDAVEGLGAMFRQNPVSQMQSAAGAAAAGQATKDGGASEPAQFVASLVGGAAIPLTSATAQAVPTVLKTADTLLQPLTKGGQEKMVAGALRSMASNPESAMAGLSNVPEYVPGSIPQSGVASGDIGLMGAQRALGSNPIAGPIINQAGLAQNAARNSYFGPIAGDAGDLAAALKARGATTGPLYDAAGQERLLRPSFTSVLNSLDQAIQNVGTSTQAGKTLLEIKNNINTELDSPTQGGLTQLYREIRDKVAATSELTGGYASAVKGVVSPIVHNLGQALEIQSPNLSEANTQFRALSQPINQMQILQDIGKRSAGNQVAPDGLPVFEQNRFANALKSNAEDIPSLTSGQQQALQNMQSDLSRSNMINAPFVKVNGSPTAYNISVGNALSRNLGVNGVGGLVRGPLDFLYSAPEESMQTQVGQAFADPNKMAALLAQSKEPIPPKDIVKLLGTALKNYGTGTATGMAAIQEGN